MAGRLSELSRVESENIRWQFVVNKITDKLHFAQTELRRYLTNNPTVHPKVTSIDFKKSSRVALQQHDTYLLPILDKLGIKAAPKLVRFPAHPLAGLT